MSFIRCSGVTTGVGPKLATSRFDQAVVAIPNLLAACKADRRSGIDPVDRKRGELWNVTTTTGDLATVSADDVTFGHDSLDFSAGVAPKMTAPLGGVAIPTSYTVGLIWTPTVDPNATALGEIFAVLGTPHGARITGTTSDVLSVRAQFGTPPVVTLTGKTKAGANVTVLSIDAAARTVAVYHNSITVASAVGGPDPYPTLLAAANVNFGGAGGTFSDGSKTRIAAAFVAGAALAATTAGQIAVRDLIEGAADTYSITLE